MRVADTNDRCIFRVPVYQRSNIWERFVISVWGGVVSVWDNEYRTADPDP